MKPHIHTITELAIFTAIAFIFSYIESLFPLPIPFPGIKLGLANLVIVLVLYKNGFCQALTVSIVRGLLNAFTFGSLFGFLYSLAGSVLSLIIMNLLKNKNRLHISAFGVSIAICCSRMACGSFCHPSLFSFFVFLRLNCRRSDWCLCSALPTKNPTL